MASIYEDPKKLQGWFDRVAGDRLATEDTWEQISDNLFGIRSFKTERMPGQERASQLYDTTALYANQLLAGALHGMLTNPSGIWFEMLPEDLRFLDDPETRMWLENSRNRMLTVFNSSATGFTTNIAELYLDIPGFGMGALWIEPNPVTAVQFSARPLREVFCEDDDQGKIDVIFRKVRLTARQFIMRFPKPMGGMPREVEEAIRTGKPEQRVDVMQILGKSDDPFAGKNTFRKKWMSSAWHKGGRSGLTMLERKGYDQMPLLTPRWSVDSDEIYGRGPGWAALADAKMLNAMQKTILKAAQKAADPPLLVSDQAVLSGIRTFPGGINYVQDRPGIGGQQEPIRALDNRARVDIGIELIDRKTQGVRNAFWSQILQMHEDPRMTATQVMALTNQAQRMMAPMLGRLQHELLEPLINRTFALMLHGGWFLPAPTSLEGEKIKVQYVSPLARSQRQSESQAILQTWQQASMVAQASQSPDALDALDAEASVRAIAEANSVPIAVIRSVQEVQERQTARADIAEEDRSTAQIGAGAEIMKTISEAGAGEEVTAA